MGSIPVCPATIPPSCPLLVAGPEKPFSVLRANDVLHGKVVEDEMVEMYAFVGPERQPARGVEERGLHSGDGAVAAGFDDVAED